MTQPLNKTWQYRAVQATGGNLSRIGTILLAALDGALRNKLREELDLGPFPAFASCASVTSDGFVMAGFIDKEGQGHMGAFVGDINDFRRNVVGLADHLELKGVEREEFLAAFRGWIHEDYRQKKELF